jgi:hypothetical protein
MMGEQFNQAKAIFLAAIDEHLPGDWPAFLDQACAGDAVLVLVDIQSHACPLPFR